MKGLDGGRPRSTEVARVFGSCFGRPDGFKSADFAQTVDFSMLYRSVWVLGADFIEIIDFLTEEVSTFEDFFQNTCRNSKISARTHSENIVRRLAQLRFQII